MRRYTQILAACALFAMVGVCASRVDAFTIIAKTGDPAPEPGTSFVGGFTFGRAMLNDLGQVAFNAQLTGVPINTSNDWGIFRGDGTTMVEISREGDLAPDGDGSIGNMNLPAINDVGQVAFSSGMSGTVNNGGVFHGSGGALTQIARKNQAAPDANGVYDLLFQPLFNDAGQAAFEANLIGTSADQGNFVGSGGVVTQIVRKGEAAPDLDGTHSILGDIAFNEVGQVAFDSFLTGTSNQKGIFRGSGGAVTQIVRQNDPAPDGNGQFGSGLSDYVFNDLGQVGFTNTLTGTVGGNNDSRGVFRGSGGAVTQVVRQGQAAPDGNGTFKSFVFPSMGNTGEIAFTGTLDGTSGGSSDDKGMFKSDGITTTQIIREGQSVPNGVGVYTSTPFDAAINDVGQVVFTSQISYGFSDGIFVYDDSAGVMEVVRRGQPLLGSTIQNFSFGHISQQGDERDGFNNKGEVAFGFQLFSGVRGIALWSPDVGSTPSNPILPGSGGAGTPFGFDNAPGGGHWFDPPLAGGYEYTTDGASNFTEVGLPSLIHVADADAQYLITSILGSEIVAAGSNLIFASPVDSFTVTGISPLVDGGDPLAFPTFLDFDQPTVNFTMTPLAAVIPLPIALPAGLAMMTAIGMRRRRTA